MLTYERAREVVNYDPETGTFTWAMTRHGRIIKGRQCGCRRKDGYLLLRIDNQLYLGHRVAWPWMTGAWPKNEIDHIDTNKSNCRWANLREATHAQNITNQNAHRDNALGHKGISKNKNGRFYVIVKNKSCGGYATLEEAKAAYQSKAKAAFGEFARS